MSSQPLEVVLANRPTTEPDANTFRVQRMTDPPTAAPADGLLLKLVVASIDPYIRGAIRQYPLDTPLTGYHVARVLQSNLPGFQQGDLVIDHTPGRTPGDFSPTLKLQSVQQHDGVGLFRVPAAFAHLPPSVWAGVLGMPGRCAYFGLLDYETGRMQPGQTVLVSGAAGAVGSLAGQLARIKGAARVVGTAGGPDKCRLVVERYGFDACLDYKALDTAAAMGEALRKAVPHGVDVYFENTGGHVTEAAWGLLNEKARVPVAGTIATYNRSAEDNRAFDVLSDEANTTTRTSAAKGLTVWRSFV